MKPASRNNLPHRQPVTVAAMACDVQLPGIVTSAPTHCWIPEMSPLAPLAQIAGVPLGGEWQNAAIVHVALSSHLGPSGPIKNDGEDGNPFQGKRCQCQVIAHSLLRPMHAVPLILVSTIGQSD
jgi:hypothetical protein